MSIYNHKSRGDAKVFGYQWGLNLLFLRFIAFMDLRYVHIHTDSWCSPLTVHDSHGGDNIDQGGCQPAV